MKKCINLGLLTLAILVSQVVSADSGVMLEEYGWKDARAKHIDYVTQFGVVNSGPDGPGCIECHNMDSSESEMGAPGCQKCHGSLYCGSEGSSALPECGKPGNDSGSVLGY